MEHVVKSVATVSKLIHHVMIKILIAVMGVLPTALSSRVTFVRITLSVGRGISVTPMMQYSQSVPIEACLEIPSS